VSGRSTRDCATRRSFYFPRCPGSEREEREREGERGERTIFRHVQLRRRLGISARSLSLAGRFYLIGRPTQSYSRERQREREGGSEGLQSLPRFPRRGLRRELLKPVYSQAGNGAFIHAGYCAPFTHHPRVPRFARGSRGNGQCHASGKAVAQQPPFGPRVSAPIVPFERNFWIEINLAATRPNHAAEIIWDFFYFVLGISTSCHLLRNV